MFLQDHYLLYLGIHSLSIYGTGDDGVLCEGVGNVNGCAVSEGSDERDWRPLAAVYCGELLLYGLLEADM